MKNIMNHTNSELNQSLNGENRSNHIWGWKKTCFMDIYMTGNLNGTYMINNNTNGELKLFFKSGKKRYNQNFVI